MAEALGVAHHHRVEHLMGTILRNRAGDDPALGVVAVELDGHIALGHLVTVGQQTLGDHHLAAGLAEEIGLPLGGVDAPDLNGVHLHGGILAQIHHGLGVHDVAAGLSGVLLAVVLLDVVHAAVFADVEGVDAVMAALVASGVVDAAACHDVHVAVVGHIEIVEHQLADAGLADDDGDIAFLAFCAGLELHVDTGLAVLAGRYFDMLGGLACLAPGVLADIESAHRLAGQVGDLFQQLRVDLGNHRDASFLSITGQPPSVSARIRGNTSSVLPRWAIWPPAMTTISSARRMIRS